MDVTSITPLILTYNEAPNIGDTLQRLKWARRVVVVDSYSSDETIEIADRFENVTVIQRRFDHFADQCNFGLSHIETEWTLSLDADYKCPPQLADELASLPSGSHSGYRASFLYCVYGRPLRASLYPKRTILYRTSLAKYSRDGHAHHVSVNGTIGDLTSELLHDDRKPLSQWLTAQGKYEELEACKLLETPVFRLGWKDRLRRWYVVAPLLTFFYCLFVKRLIFDGRAGWYYTLQRVYAELLLSLTLLDRKLRPTTSRLTEPPPENPSGTQHRIAAENYELSHTGD